MYQISASQNSIKQEFELPFSKSESNRALIIQALAKCKIEIKNLSTADDTTKLAELIQSDAYELNAGDGGTTFRFLLALLCLKNEEHILTGSQRLCQRPVKILADALNKLGSNITYMNQDGFPPLKISKGSIGQSDFIKVDADISSQFISALLLIAPCLKNGLRIELVGKVLSWPYIEMTLKMMQHCGVNAQITKTSEGNSIIAFAHQEYGAKAISITADWSAASYFYACAVLSDAAEITLPGLKLNSFQGDEKIAELMNKFGIETSAYESGVLIRKVSNPLMDKFEFDFMNQPDLAQTMAFTCASLGMEAQLNGLYNLSVKETNRIQALKTEIEKAGTIVQAGDSWLHIEANNNVSFENVRLSSYNDHRMIMSAVPLALKFKTLFIDDIKDVSKSFPGFLAEIKKAGINIEQHSGETKVQ